MSYLAGCYNHSGNQLIRFIAENFCILIGLIKLNKSQVKVL